MYKDQL
jgi:hypothetical protein